MSYKLIGSGWLMEIESKRQFPMRESNKDFQKAKLFLKNNFTPDNIKLIDEDVIEHIKSISELEIESIQIMREWILTQTDAPKKLKDLDKEINDLKTKGK